MPSPTQHSTASAAFAHRLVHPPTRLRVAKRSSTCSRSSAPLSGRADADPQPGELRDAPAPARCSRARDARRSCRAAAAAACPPADRRRRSPPAARRRRGRRCSRRSASRQPAAHRPRRFMNVSGTISTTVPALDACARRGRVDRASPIGAAHASGRPARPAPRQRHVVTRVGVTRGRDCPRPTHQAPRPTSSPSPPSSPSPCPRPSALLPRPSCPWR